MWRKRHANAKCMSRKLTYIWNCRSRSSMWRRFGRVSAVIAKLANLLWMRENGYSWELRLHLLLSRTEPAVRTWQTLILCWKTGFIFINPSKQRVKEDALKVECLCTSIFTIDRMGTVHVCRDGADEGDGEPKCWHQTVANLTYRHTSWPAAARFLTVSFWLHSTSPWCQIWIDTISQWNPLQTVWLKPLA